MTNLLYEIALEKLKCIIEDIALVIPQPKHSTLNRFLKKQILDARAKYSVGIAASKRKTVPINKRRASRNR